MLRQALGHARAGDDAQRLRDAVQAQEHDRRRVGDDRRLLDDRLVDAVEVQRLGHGLRGRVQHLLGAGAARLALEQLGALERQRGEVREDLGDAQLLLAQPRARRGGRQGEHAERAPARGAHRAGDERRRPVPGPGGLGGRRVEVLAQARAQRLAARPVRDVAEQQRAPALDRRLGHAAAVGVVGPVEHRLQRRADRGRLEPGGRGADVAALPVDDLKRAAVDVEEHADLHEDLLERAAQPGLGARRMLDPRLRPGLAHEVTIAPDTEAVDGGRHPHRTSVLSV